MLHLIPNSNGTYSWTSSVVAKRCLFDDIYNNNK
jgi:hypothetical protein